MGKPLSNLIMRERETNQRHKIKHDNGEISNKTEPVRKIIISHFCIAVQINVHLDFKRGTFLGKCYYPN